MFFGQIPQKTPGFKRFFEFCPLDCHEDERMNEACRRNESVALEKLLQKYFCQLCQLPCLRKGLLLGTLEHVLSSHSVGNFNIPTDFPIFQRGRSTTNQLNNAMLMGQHPPGS